MLKVLLVNPRFLAHHPPLGLGYLSSYLKKYLGEPVDIRLFDEVVNNEDIPTVIYDFKPDLVGISIVTPTFKRAAMLCQQIRAVTKAPIIAGGVHVTAVPECIMEAPIDVGVVGEGEATFLELVQHYLKTGQVMNSNIAGIVYKKDSSLIHTPRRPLIAKLDTIPPPDRTLFDMRHYARPNRMAHGLYAKGTSMMPSRGCPYHKCNFCSSNLMWGDTVRFFSPQYVANEMQSIVDEYGLNFVIFLDDNFTTRLKWLEKLCTLLDERGLTKRVRFDCESIAAFMDDARAAILKKMGCVRIEFGFESGCPRILHILKSGKSRLEHNECAIEICRHHGIPILGNMIVGYIDETPEESDESVSWFRKQPIDCIAPRVYTPYPETEGWNECIARGIIDMGKVNWNQFTTGSDLCVNTVFPPGELEQRFLALNDEFAHRNRVIVIDHGLSLKERLKLYSQVPETHGGLILQGTNHRMPWIYLIMSQVVLTKPFTLYRKAVALLKEGSPTLYYLLRRIKRKVSFVLGLSRQRPDASLNLAGDRDIEWSWVASQMPTGPGEALDFGPGGSHLGLIAAQRGFNVTAVDLEPVYWPYVHPGLQFVQGDILKLSYPTEHFDLVINCSSVEHVGLAGRYGITENCPDGDLEAMARLRDLMKPSGVMLLTIPVGQDAIFAPLHRVYGAQRLPQLLEGYTVEREAFWVKDGQNRWVLCDKETALNFKASAGSWNPLQNVYALGCFVLRRPEREE